jgi:hypothetical protein
VAVITFNGSFSGSNKAFKEKEVRGTSFQHKSLCLLINFPIQAELRQSAKSAGVVLSDKPEQAR